VKAPSKKKPAESGTGGPLPPGNLKQHHWQRFLWGPDPEVLEQLYVPALGEAVRYDRCCAYFSSSVLAAAARGFGKLIERLLSLGKEAPRPAVRLVVNEELDQADVRALLETGDTAKLTRHLLKRLKSPRELLEKQRLAMLAWLAREGFLAVRVGVMRSGSGIVHAKFGMMTDAQGEAVVFMGTDNETAQGLVANFECLELSTSWGDPERYQVYRQKFEDLWTDRDAAVHTVPLPEAVRLKLIKFAPPEPPIAEPTQARARQQAAMVWRFLLEAPYFPDGGLHCDGTAPVTLWPNQRRVVEEAAQAWPEGRLLCDEVGLGKTIEAILILRRLLAGRGVRRALLLTPAGLLEQWQGELREKGGLIVPRLEGLNLLVWPDGRSQRISGLAAALRHDLLLLSRETARADDHRVTLLQAEPWDLVLLDEAHAARRGRQEEGEYNSATLLLRLLRELQLKGRARGFLLLSATPMQTQPWEPWDLLAILGEGGAWLADFAGVRNYYRTLAALRRGQVDRDTAREAAVMIAADPEFPPPPSANLDLRHTMTVAQKLAFAPSSQRQALVNWLRQGSPLARRMHRNTRQTLRRYYELGLLPASPPKRRVHDLEFDYQDPAERQVYQDIKRYIDRRYELLEGEKPGKGFVMTIYRRRATSSPLALERSLKKREMSLRRKVEDKASDWYLPPEETPEALNDDDLPEGEVSSKISLSLPPDPQQALAELQEVEGLLRDLERVTTDSKLNYFFDVLKGLTSEGKIVLVFSEYTDTIEYLREKLVPYYGKTLGCYRGAGGQVWDGEKWRAVSKGEITEVLNQGKLRILLCTDAASEGLNLQAAGAIINYDLPWSPSKVEQRIGRIDRIGQELTEVLVVNLFLKDSVDDKVYRALRHRCGLFEHFVGAMQPVLARARRMLMGQEQPITENLVNLADQVEHDPLASETYMESEPSPDEAISRGITLKQMEKALTLLDGQVGPAVHPLRAAGVYKVTISGQKGIVYGAQLEALEKDLKLRPLSPFDSDLREVMEKLWRPGERLPLVVNTHQQGAFRVSVAYWVSGKQIKPIGSVEQLEGLIKGWDGEYPDPGQWQRAVKKAAQTAKKAAQAMALKAIVSSKSKTERQLAAARLRLTRELGRFLMCLAGEETDLNQTWQSQMARDTATASRLQQCLDRLGGYVDWAADLQWELRKFFRNLNDNQIKARCLGREVDAALQDPRWGAERSIRIVK
jgi:hypothetical protein